MKKYAFLLTAAIAFCTAAEAQTVNYSPAYFGPNANPVPEFSDVSIPAETTVKLSGSCYFGFGDNTNNITFDVEVPLLPERVSLKVWADALEHYKVTQRVYDERNMEGGSLTGKAGGDFYVQTRMLIFTEKRYRPAVILNSTLKTASGTNFGQRRYFDTPGYYFDVEIGKSIHLKNKLVHEIRAAADLGFMCWETTNSTQNDAPMYGGKIILSNDMLDFENSLLGYYGWINNGDKPLVYSSKLTFKRPGFNLFVRYQYGIKDFPYHHVQAGAAFMLPRLTPKY